mmetsp:Transcript_1171/g.2001  ORF Transcript_1171/g.2001 Transcript_1171/m.2001 type:complete len:304 (+) Transcript_1171:40-951(+)
MLRFESFHVVGSTGENGSSRNRRGRRAKDITLTVPLGTVVKKVYRCETTGQRTTDDEPIADLDQQDQTFICAKGGNGGLGNVSFRRGYRKRPEFRTTGQQGDSLEIFLELKTLADVGLVGFPNAGKSSFLRQVSKANPKIGHYPFTTLQPHVGKVEANDPALTVFSVADIPGLLEGASQGRGLGHHFLRHIERTKVLLFIIDCAGTDFRDPLQDFETLRNELVMYSERFSEVPALVFLNKSDISEESDFVANENRIREISPYKVISGSAKEGTGGIPEVVSELHVLLQKIDPERFPVYKCPGE